jgi:O-antigen/teichoic acid export membrane protein
MNPYRELAHDSFFSAIVHLAPRFANVFLFIVIGRLAGPAQAGVFALATTYLLIFTTLMRGLDDLVIREVSRQPDLARSYLANFLLLRLALSGVLYAVLLIVVRYVFAYPLSTSTPIMILTLSLVPDSLGYVALAVMLGSRRFKAPAIILSIATLVKFVGGAAVALMGGSLAQIAWVWFAGSLVSMALLMIYAVNRLGWIHSKEWTDWSPLRGIWQATAPFLLITILTTIESQTDTVVLSNLHNEAEVGFYNAATTLAFSLALISQAYRLSVYPMMARLAAQTPNQLAKLNDQSLRYLGMLVLPMGSGLFLLAPQIVELIYGSRFQPTALVLRLLSPVLIFMFLNVPSARVMLVKDHQGMNTLFLLISAILNVGLNLILDPRLGAQGAGIARLCSFSINFLLTYLFVKQFLLPSNLLQLLSRPILATLGMSAVVWVLRGQFVLLTILAGVISYGVILWLVGGITQEDLAMFRSAFLRRREQAVVE